MILQQVRSQQFFERSQVWFCLDMHGKAAPCGRILSCEVVHFMRLVFGGVVGMSWDELISVVGESGWVLVDVGSWCVEMIVCWPILRAEWGRRKGASMEARRM